MSSSSERLLEPFPEGVAREFLVVALGVLLRQLEQGRGGTLYEDAARRVVVAREELARHDRAPGRLVGARGQRQALQATRSAG